MGTLSISFGYPQADEYHPYYHRYISLVGSDHIIGLLQTQAPETSALFKSANTRADFRYAPGKWSVKEMLGHINDTERIMAYRALRIARGDKTPIEGYEQDDYVRDGHFEQRSLADLIQEFSDVRTATVALFRNLDAESGLRRGIANKNEVSARALAYIIAGHELHHRRVLQEKYLK